MLNQLLGQLFDLSEGKRKITESAQRPNMPYHENMFFSLMAYTVKKLTHASNMQNVKSLRG